MTKEKIDRINVLARKSKTEGLNPEEKEEQAKLRAEYLEKFRDNFRGHLESIKFVDDDCVEKGKEKN
ncbi:DUF896 domain-containing protein [Anoxybacterium hadale]|uniref:DUF896 domain-containing protein n=1 Tax=Anoxybacterium hadale TaxID=3408580 RepID=A0ACD1AIB0_9FIRM|nr:DUF896 domain-containing protein [Clostridiales bacterium]